ncbi:MAG TPA: hypothetical protein VKY74_21120 [Chloroflexia bacterium]|nr:hypothetical protein [Chloroflexia bacterium]
MRIVSVNGTQFTLAPVDPNVHGTFVFDLATRQWLALTPGPSPSP